MNDAFNAIPLSERELKILARMSAWIVRVWLWIVTFIVVPWFLLGAISTVGYFILYSWFNVLNDESQVLAVPELNNAVEVVGPRQLLTEDTPYTLTLSSTPSITQPLTMTLLRKTGVSVDPQPSFSFTFSPDSYRSYRIPFRRSGEDNEAAIFTFNKDDSATQQTIAIPIPKAYAWLLWLHKTFVFTSLTEGIAPLIVSIVTVLLAVGVQRGEQWQTKQLFAKLRQAARSSEPQTKIEELYDKLDSRSAYLSDQQTQLVDNLINLPPRQLLDLIEHTKEWRVEYIGRILGTRSKWLAQRLLDLDEEGIIQLDLRQRSKAHNILGWSPAHRPILDPGYKPGGFFEPEAERAEYDDPAHFCEEALLEEDRPSELADNQHIRTFVVCGRPGAGKTALLKQLHIAMMARIEPPLPIMLSFEPRLNDPSILVNRCLEQAADYLFKLMLHEPEKWIALSDTQRMAILNYAAHVLSLPASEIDKLAQQVYDKDLSVGREFRTLWKEVRQNGQITARGQQQIQMLVEIAQSLGYSALLVCLDDVDSTLHVRTLHTTLESTFNLPVLVVVAYKAGSPIPAADLSPNSQILDLTWDGHNTHGLGKILDYRTQVGASRPLAEEVRAELLKIVQVPRDFWPWWNLLTDPLIHPDPQQDISLPEWNRAKALMTRVQRLGRLPTDRWTMEHYHEARRLLTQEVTGQ